MTTEIVKALCVPFPPLPEQAAIAAYLDLEMAKLDALVGKVEEAVERLQEYRTALITAAVTGKIDVAAARQYHRAMITRLYANNFRCLVAFKTEFDSFGVLCGPNGAGKSSVFDALRTDSKPCHWRRLPRRGWRTGHFEPGVH